MGRRGRVTDEARLIPVVREQAGVFGRRQALDAGVTPAQIRAELAGGRIRRALPSTYVAYTGPLTPLTRIWAALVYAGPGAVASHATAAWLWGLRDDLPDVLDVTVPADRRVVHRQELRLHTCEHLDDTRHPNASPPRTRVEPTVLSLVALARDAETVVGLLASAVQRRRTTAVRLADEARSFRRLRHRALVREVLADVATGTLSNLERHWIRDVERAHGLPRGECSVASVVGGRRRFADIRYRRYRVVVELDGRQTHPDETAHREMWRDNRSAAEGEQSLRFGWADVGRPCEAALLVAGVLRHRGWRGRLRPCGPGCLVRAAA